MMRHSFNSLNFCQQNTVNTAFKIFSIMEGQGVLDNHADIKAA